MFFCYFFSVAQTPATREPVVPEFVQYENSTWVDSVMQSLTPKERIAQLIMVAAFSNKGEEHKQEILELIREQKIGGLLFFQGGPVRQGRLMNEYQAASKVPLLGAIDAEWGLGMRLDSTLSYPFQMALGAIQDESLIYKMGGQIAEQIQRSGLHLNFAPVLDINNNPENPVINYRSFGEDKYNVTRKSIAYMRGMQDRQLMTTAKHFPGHGDTDTDSHYALPTIAHSRSRLDSLELYPFRELINAGIGGVMVAHLDIPALEPGGLPSTLSKNIITHLLKEELGFKGLTVTDAMNMKGVTKGNLPGIVDKDAILAGNDMLEFTEDVPKAIDEIYKAIEQGLISQEEIDRRCRKILAVKYWVGLHNYEPTSLENIIEELNSPEAQLLNKQLTEASLTVLKNEEDLLPLRSFENYRIASVSIGVSEETAFQKNLSLYSYVDHFTLEDSATVTEIASLRTQLMEYDMVIAGIHESGQRPHNILQMTPGVQEFVKDLSEQKNSIISFFKNPYVLDKIEGIENVPALIVAYQDSENSEELAAQLIFGGISANGKLPVSVGEKFKVGDGIEVKGDSRFKYTIPEDAGINSIVLNNGIDSLIHNAINNRIIPGGQLLVAKDQKVVFNKAYGNHSYKDSTKVKLSDVYDIASATTLASALPVIMRLYDQGKFDQAERVEDHFPQLRNTSVGALTIREILARNSFRSETNVRKLRKAGTSVNEINRRENFPQEGRRQKGSRQHRDLARESDLIDLGLSLLPEILEKITGEDLTNHLEEQFYFPLGANSITYRPLEKFMLSQIVPSGNFNVFGRGPIHGVVHTDGALVMSGFSAGGGLFSNANDLAKLLQMYLNGGSYGGKEYIAASTIKEFLGISFDEQTSGLSKQPGGSGLVISDPGGVLVWMDPEKELLFIFLSNKLIRDRENFQQSSSNLHKDLLQVLYKAIE